MKPSKNLRPLVFINYLSLVVMFVVACVGEVKGWDWFLGGIEIAFFILLLITFIQTQVKTGLWSFVHKKVENLDEREHEISFEALRHSYGIFTIVVLVVLLFLMVTSDSSFSENFKWVYAIMRPFFIGTLYFAHTLPTAVLIWKRKSVFYDGEES